MSAEHDKKCLVDIMKGEYKQWTGLLEWNTGMDYWNDLFLILRVFIMHCEFFCLSLNIQVLQACNQMQRGVEGSEELPVSTSFLVLTLI